MPKKTILRLLYAKTCKNNAEAARLDAERTAISWRKDAVSFAFYPGHEGLSLGWQGS
jgi:hypothetical protein